MPSNLLKKQYHFYWLILSFLAIIIINSCSSDQQDDSGALDIREPSNMHLSVRAVIDSMEAGFNLGNTFDNGKQSTSPESIYPIIDLYHQAGMKHIRIPVTWMDGFGGNTLADVNGTVNFEHPRFIQLKAVIDYALDKELFVVINAHHEHWLKDNYDGSAKFNQPFSHLWQEIANYFKDYPVQLIFEVLNEPEGTMGQWSGDFPKPTDSLALAYTREINKVGYDAIRGAGGQNASRIIMVAPNGQGNQSMFDETYPTQASLPGNGTDPYLAIQVHTYDPWNFAGQDGSNKNYPGDDEIAANILKVAAHADKLGIPVNYGEFGVGRRDNREERDTELVRGFYRTIKETTLEEDMSFTPWDDRGWFGLITRDGLGEYQFVYDLVPSMME